MSVETVLEAVRELSIDDQRWVAETILDELEVDPDVTVISEAEKEFIEKRLASYRANPERVRPFDVVIDELERRIAKHESDASTAMPFEEVSRLCKSPLGTLSERRLER